MSAERAAFKALAAANARHHAEVVGLVNTAIDEFYRDHPAVAVLYTRRPFCVGFKQGSPCDAVELDKLSKCLLALEANIPPTVSLPAEIQAPGL